MLPALVTLKNLIKTKSYHIDLPFFRLHYQVTVCLLLAFCLILTAKVLFGDTIDCIRDAKRDDIWDNACYSIGTYTRYMVDSNGQSNWIDNAIANVTFKADKNSRYFYTGLMVGDHKNSKHIRVFWHNYYQYVPILLFIQAVFFYIPHYMWKLWENGTISSVCKRLHDNRFNPTDYFDTNYDIIYYLQSSFKFNRSLVYKYYFCHVLCLLNLVLQIIALNIIFNYQFVSYGYLVVKYLFFDEDIYGLKPVNPETVEALQQTNLNNPMDLVFPKITACHIELASAAGKATIVMENLCVLPLNILHDKFFLLLWFWFLILIVLTILQIVYDIMFTLLPFFRRNTFTRRYGFSPWDSDNHRSSSLAEIFLLDIIGHNSDKFAFSALLRKLNKDDWTASPSESQSVV